MEQEGALMVKKKVKNEHYNRYFLKVNKIERIYRNIENVEDLINVFIKGKAKSRNTYMVYTSSIRHFFIFTKRKHPRDVTIGDIENFYDHLCECRVCMGRDKTTENDDDNGNNHCSRCVKPKVGYNNNKIEEKECKWGRPLSKKTVNFKITALKTLFKEIEKYDPLFENPFQAMNDELKRKLSGKRAGGAKDRSLDFLTENEVINLMRWLKHRVNDVGGDILERIKRYRDFALVFMLITSGLRSAELLSLKWADIEEIDGKLYAKFIGKGGMESSQQLYPDAVEACRKYFRMRFRKDPAPSNYVFTNIFHNCSISSKLKYPNMRILLDRIAEEAFAQKIIKRKVRLKPHTFRRTYATLFYKHQMGLKDISLLLRHRNVETTSEYYLPNEADPLPVLNDVFGEL